jgi:hypothetical protein
VLSNGTVAALGALLVVAGCGSGVEAAAKDGAGTALEGGPPVEASTSEVGATSDAAAGASEAGDGSLAVVADAGTGSPALPPRLYGVTVDDVSNPSAIVASLAALPHEPTARIVFDEGQPAPYYAQPLAAIHGVAHVLGAILDSQYVQAVSVQQYTQRASSYLAALGSLVDVWEVGNEINGNWLGATPDVAAKMTGAFDLAKAAGARTELTLYGCSDSGAAYDMITWVQANVPARMLTGLDYVLVSYYEGDCGAPRTDWTAAFLQLRGLFPGAGIGFGEVGYVDTNGNDITSGNETAAAAYLQRYYGMPIPVPGYVGGHFWWYFAEDMVPSNKPLFGVLSAAMQ